MDNSETLRQVSRDAVRARIASVAEDLVLEQGYSQTTVDQIARRVGMSQRTFFRYFETKEDAVLLWFDDHRHAFLDALQRRPLDESAWDSLRRVFDFVVSLCGDPGQRDRLARIMMMLRSSATLMAAYLEKRATLQSELCAALSGRELGRVTDADVVLPALVASALACLESALMRMVAAPDTTDLGATLDVTMAALRPAIASSVVLGPGVPGDAPRG